MWACARVCVSPDLASLMVFWKEYVPGSYVSVHEAFLGEVGEPWDALTTVAQQSVRQARVNTLSLSGMETETNSLEQGVFF